MYDVLIIGCGIVGAAAAYELSRYRLRIAILEKENDVAMATTKANSAILHAGYDPRPGTLMARLNIEGARLAKTICGALDVPYEPIGSLVLAFSEEEQSILKELLHRGEANGVPDLALLDADAVRKLEPNVNGQVTGALYAPTAAVVSPWEYALAMAETAVCNGAELYRRNAVTAIHKLPGEGYQVCTSSSVYEARYILNAAGVHAGEIHEMLEPAAFRIQPNRGQYYLLDKSEGTRVSHILFQCPTKVGKGVLVAPTVHGNLIVGPNAEDVADGNHVATTTQGLTFVSEMAKKSVPSIRFRESIRNFAGVRANSDSDDFRIGEAEGMPGFIDLAGIKSPGLTAAPAIARYAAELLQKSGLELTEKQNFFNNRKRIRWKELSQTEQNALIQRDSRYGRVICRCETITEGEIVEALHTPIPAASVDGVKRRCNAGMGRCQGGFCGPRVMEIIARELGISPAQVPQDADGTILITGETKA